VLAQGDDIVPIPGTKREAIVDENVAAADIALSNAEQAKLLAVFTPGVAAGTRYPAKQLAGLGI
jgi:aryl-alcohol dehydrogenase-like predicted oxidoreductase